MTDGNIITPEAKKWGMLSHLSTFSGFIIPLGNIIIPLIIWLTKKDDNKFVADQAKEVLNFQISLLVYFIVGILVILFSIFRSSEHMPLNIVVTGILLVIIWIFDFIITIVGAVRANEGVWFRYPLSIRFIK